MADSLKKVENHGITGKVLRWLNEWLSGRKQRVCINGQCSTWEAVTSGVPQGSVLGPVLFLIFINDLDSNLLSSVLKFADDTKVFGRVNSDKDREVLQQDLHRLMNWSDRWQMPFNASKCKVMHLGNGNSRFSYFMGDHKLESVNEEKDLGIFITDNLKPTLVRPHLEYCSSAWSPYYEKDKFLLERVQHRFTRMVPGLKLVLRKQT